MAAVGVSPADSHILFQLFLNLPSHLKGKEAFAGQLFLEACGGDVNKVSIVEECAQVSRNQNKVDICYVYR